MLGAYLAVEHRDAERAGAVQPLPAVQYLVHAAVAFVMRPPHLRTGAEGEAERQGERGAQPHKATAEVAKRSRLVCVESLNVSGWMRKRRLSRSTADASPSRFLSLLRWKCRRKGARLVETGWSMIGRGNCSL